MIRPHDAGTAASSSPPSAPAPLSLSHLSHRYPSGTLALQDVSMQVQAGEFVSLLGPSGCGKSTVLRLVAGLESPSSGLLALPPQAGVGFVFQAPTLMPWATVADNVALPLRIAGVAPAERAARTAPLLQRVGLAAFAKAHPGELSGGMQMRASLARALVTQPALLLMDEPFAALDEITRQQLGDDLLGLWRQQRCTVLFVTHSVFEAVYLSQRVLVMGARPGRIVADIAQGDAPPQRGPAYRASAAYAARCAEVSAALQQAMATP